MTKKKSLRRTKGEQLVENYLIKHNFKYQFQYGFKDCKFINTLKFDFAVFNNKDEVEFLIEYDGKQHFYPIDYFGGYDALLRNQIRDNVKTEYCRDKKIKLIRIPYLQHNKAEKTLNDYMFNNKYINYGSMMRSHVDIDEILDKEDQKKVYGFALDDLDDLHEEDRNVEFIEEQLSVLEKQGTYQLYMYLVDLYKMSIADDGGLLYYEILNNDFRDTGVF